MVNHEANRTDRDNGLLTADAVKEINDYYERSATVEAVEIKFSPRYHENQDRAYAKDRDPCYICGRGIIAPRYYVRIAEGGSHITTDEYAERHPAGDMYFFPIGPECYKNLSPEAKALVRSAPGKE